jgi:hypothetical protein
VDATHSASSFDLHSTLSHTIEDVTSVLEVWDRQVSTLALAYGWSYEPCLIELSLAEGDAGPSCRPWAALGTLAAVQPLIATSYSCDYKRNT